MSDALNLYLFYWVKTTIQDYVINPEKKKMLRHASKFRMKDKSWNLPWKILHILVLYFVWVRWFLLRRFLMIGTNMMPKWGRLLRVHWTSWSKWCGVNIVCVCVSVTIQGPQYIGLLLQARSGSNTNAVGTWKTPPANTKYLAVITRTSHLQHKSMNV